MPGFLIAGAPPAEQPAGDSVRLQETERIFESAVAPEHAERIDGLITRLLASGYHDRVAAQTALIDLGIAPFPQLRSAYLGSDDLEQRLQIEKIVQRAYLNYHLFDQTAFLGITFHPPYYPSHLDFESIPEGQRGILITSVMPQSAADRAGLRPEDIILAVDGVKLDDLGGTNIGEAFGATISAYGPGAEVTLTVLKASPAAGRSALYAPQEVGITLLRRPESTYERTAAASRLEKAKEDFEAWWRRYFAVSTAPSPPEPAANRTE